MGVRFSRRTNWTRSVNAVTTCRQDIASSAESLLDLTISNPTRCGLPDDPVINEEALEGLGRIEYRPDPKGIPEARQEVARYYAGKGMEVPPDRIFLTASTSEAYTYAFRLLADPGDGVGFGRPGYPLFDFLADVNDVVACHYDWRYRRGRWRLSLERLEGAAVPLKALVGVHPNNPTGAFITPEDRKRLNQWCAAHQAALIVDEVFHDFILEGEAPSSFVSNDEVLTFVLGGLSKTLALPQMKLSWMVLSGPDPEVEEACARLEIIADTYLSVNTPAQMRLSRWLDRRIPVQEGLLARLRRNERVARAVLDKTAAQWLAPEGGWSGVIRLPDGWDEEETVLRLMRQEGVVVQPGYFFNFQEEDLVVVSLLTDPEVFDEGMRRLARILKTLE